MARGVVGRSKIPVEEPAPSIPEACVAQPDEDCPESSKEEEGDPDEGWVDTRSRRRRRLEFALACLCNMAWTIDSALLPLFYKEFEDMFGVSETALTALGSAKGWTAALFAFPCGFAAELLPRPQLIGCGMLFWALGLAVCGAAWSFEMLLLGRVLNGMGLGIVQPLLYSLVAESHAPSRRGLAFGSMFFIGSVCNTLFGYFATAYAATQFGGVAGWRLSMAAVAFFSGLVGVAIMCVVREPNLAQVLERRRQDNFLSVFRANIPKVTQLFKIPTFVLVLCQGAPGTAPWTVFPLFTEWLELSCFTHAQTALIVSMFNWGCACSQLLSGCLLNSVGRRFPDHGPPTIAAFSVASGIPFLLLFFFVLPTPLTLGAGSQQVSVHCLAFFAFGLGASMCGTVNKKVFSDIVPASAFSYVFAVDNLIEQGLGNFAGLAVGVLTDRVFQYDPRAARAGSCAPQEARKLGMGMFVVSNVGWGICFTVYLFMQCTYPKDRRRQLKLRRAQSLRAEAKLAAADEAEAEKAEVDEAEHARLRGPSSDLAACAAE